MAKAVKVGGGRVRVVHEEFTYECSKREGFGWVVDSLRRNDGLVIFDHGGSATLGLTPTPPLVAAQAEWASRPRRRWFRRDGQPELVEDDPADGQGAAAVGALDAATPPGP